MQDNLAAAAIAAAALAAVLAWAVRRPWGWPEAVAAIPAAALVIAVRAVSLSAALAEARRLWPVVGFLGCVLVLAKLCDDEGLFPYLGGWLSRSASTGQPSTGQPSTGQPSTGQPSTGQPSTGQPSTGQPSTGQQGAGRLLVRVFAAAAVTTAVLSLDATVVLLTPVVLIAAGRLRVPARPHAYACGHLANSASLLLPVSNLTNLLAFAVSGLSFGRFALLMALPWVAVIAVEYLVIRRFFAVDLSAGGDLGAGGGRTERADVTAARTGNDGAVEVKQAPVMRPPVFSLLVVGATLGGFIVASAAGANPAWAALGGAAMLAVRGLRRGSTSVAAVARAADVPFLLFVLALGIVVTAVVDNGLGSALRPVIPAGSSLPALLAIAFLAAALAALVNNLPAVLVLLPLVAVTAGAGPVLAVLLGVNIGPNLTYTGSLATLLWRRVLRAYDADVKLREFTVVGALTVLPGLALCVLCLWAALRV